MKCWRAPNVGINTLRHLTFCVGELAAICGKCRSTNGPRVVLRNFRAPMIHKTPIYEVLEPNRTSIVASVRQYCPNVQEADLWTVSSDRLGYGVGFVRDFCRLSTRNLARLELHVFADGFYYSALSEVINHVPDLTLIVAGAQERGSYNDREACALLMSLAGGPAVCFVGICDVF